jgi:hypothetical protein
MTATIDLRRIKPLQHRLNRHPVYEQVGDMTGLRLFMEHHVYAVWDFMSLLKCLQHRLAPATVPWVPTKTGRLQRFINEIVLEEESDRLPGGDGYISHFELYCDAMDEIGADSGTVRRFVDRVAGHSLEHGLAYGELPPVAERFMRGTFRLIATGKPHVVAAAFTLGREQVVPLMFQRLLQVMGVGAAEAPMFHYYLERHVELDGDSHGPLAIALLEELCQGDGRLVTEALRAAETAILARIAFWDSLRDILRRPRYIAAA